MTLSRAWIVRTTSPSDDKKTTTTATNSKEHFSIFSCAEFLFCSIFCTSVSFAWARICHRSRISPEGFGWIKFAVHAGRTGNRRAPGLRGGFILYSLTVRPLMPPRARPLSAPPLKIPPVFHAQSHAYTPGIEGERGATRRSRPTVDLRSILQQRSAKHFLSLSLSLDARGEPTGLKTLWKIIINYFVRGECCLLMYLRRWNRRAGWASRNLVLLAARVKISSTVFFF